MVVARRRDLALERWRDDLGDALRGTICRAGLLRPVGRPRQRAASARWHYRRFVRLHRRGSELDAAPERAHLVARDRACRRWGRGDPGCLQRRAFPLDQRWQQLEQGDAAGCARRLQPVGGRDRTLEPGCRIRLGAGPPIVSDVPTPYLWRRAGGGWTLQGAPPGVATGQAWYDWFAAVAPDNASQIYLGAISVHRGTLAGGAWTWVDIAGKGAGDSIHPDSHAIAFEPGRPATIYVGNDGGMYRSPDRGTTWQHLNNGLTITEFEYIAQNYGSSRWLIGGTQDNGTERWRGSPVWEHVADGDGGDCGVNRLTPTTVFHTFYGSEQLLLAHKER